MQVLLVGLAGILGLTENLWLENVAGPSIPLEHCMIDHVPQIYQRWCLVNPTGQHFDTYLRTKRLPVDGDQLRTSRPIAMRQIVGRAYSCTFRVYSNQVRLAVLD